MMHKILVCFRIEQTNVEMNENGESQKYYCIIFISFVYCNCILPQANLCMGLGGKVTGSLREVLSFKLLIPSALKIMKK